MCVGPFILSSGPVDSTAKAAVPSPPHGLRACTGPPTPGGPTQARRISCLRPIAYVSAQPVVPSLGTPAGSELRAHETNDTCPTSLGVRPCRIRVPDGRARGPQRPAPRGSRALVFRPGRCRTHARCQARPPPPEPDATRSPLLTRPEAPWLRWEGIDQSTALGESRRRRTLQRYVEHFNSERPRHRLGNRVLGERRA